MARTLSDLGRWDLVTKYVYPNPADRAYLRHPCDEWRDHMEQHLADYLN